ncbi:ATP-dependent Clp protease proteolytic subunit [Endozoicomonas sp. ONNA2]|uniref:ATP-dependent Clp protease proteolytic subunit n=1 Tax=Endozoicomonas sp. ONNA2 TaxID=2828741 RepID=UPI002148631E|nr:ATP-dependent Clp protease proteolytic subunit [Endozoicomonas sp. ONNA2]
MSVSVTAGPGILAALGSVNGAVVTIFTGLAAGVGASILAAFLADNVYAKCRHVAPSVAPVQLSRVISYAPEASGTVLAEIFCPGNDTTLSPNFPELPPYSPELPPPLYSSQEALDEQCPSGGGHSS